jgi:hypothetical protein
MVLLSVAVLAVVMITLSAKKLGAAQAQLQAAQSALQRLSREAQEVLELRGREQRVELRQRPQQDVIAQVNAVLAEVGIPSRNLRSLSPESDSQVASAATTTKLKRQSLRLVLENLSLQEIGGFLIKWRSSQQIWTTTRIELTHIRGQEQDANDDHYDATLVISALYVEDHSDPDTVSASQPRT